MELKGSVALVTGGGRGIGLAIVRALASAGVRVVLDDAGLSIDGHPQEPELASRVEKELRGEGLEVRGSSLDVSTWENAKTLHTFATETYGPPDILVNNAAILQDRMVFNLEESSFEAVLRNDLFSAFYLTHLVSRSLRERLQGRIVNIVSTSGLIGNRGQANYGAAKGGLVALSRVTALELARYGVTVNAVAPFAHTRVTETLQPTTPWLAEYLSTVKGAAEPASVGNLVRYLCSDKAKVLTGQVFGVRGDEVFLFSQPRPVGTAAAGKGKELTDDFLSATFAEWENEGLFTPLETDLMHFHRRFK
jgi:NAD(P)-dependent dehydrogenase (short-subunit alcohol dehydrogenase family)